jgi:hypothetical protein
VAEDTGHVHRYVDMTLQSIHRYTIGFALAAAVRGATAQTLANAHVRAEFDKRGLRALTDLADGHRYSLEADGFSVTVDDETLTSSDTPLTVQIESQRVTYRYYSSPVALDVRYELRPGWRFLSKQIEVRVLRADSFRVREIELIRQTFDDSPTSFYEPSSVRPNLQTGAYGSAARFDQSHSMLVVVQNPFLTVRRDGRALAIRYAPDMDWRSEYGPFISDRALIAPLRLSGRTVAASMIPEWQATSPGPEQQGLDEAEIAAFTGMVRAFLLYRPARPINVFVGWCANDYQIDAGTSEGRADYRDLIDRAAALGAQYVLYAPSNSALSRREDSVDDWSWEHVLWLGLGQKIRRNEWNPRSSPIPPSVQEMLDYARGKRVGLLAYVYPVLPFSQNPEWLVPSRNDPKRQSASLSNRALQDWLIDELVAFHRRTGIAGYAFDHTFLTFEGSSRYAQWWGWRRVMEALRRRVPDLVIDGRQAYHLYGPWSWLAGSYPHPTFNDEQPESFTPYPDLHFDRVSADRERYTAYRYRNYEFAPSEIVPGFITHQTSRSNDQNEMPSVKTTDRGVVLLPYRVRDWDYLGWRYSLLSSIAVGGWNNVLNMIPARDSAERESFSQGDRAWLRRWLDWTVANREYLRNTRTILGQPAFGKIDGTSAIVGNRGFVFLFNPDARRLAARVKLNESIGLRGTGRFVLRELYPMEGTRIGKPGVGTWRAGDDVTLEIDGGSARVLEIQPATDVSAPMLFNAPGRVALENGVLDVRDVRGEVGTTATLLVALPRGARVTRARVNGVEVSLGPRRGDVVEFRARFDGAEFRRLQAAAVGESTFTGGALRGEITIPKRVFDQLAARKRAWPIPWTAEDSLTTWLVPDRLLLYAQFAEPNDKLDVRLRIDGESVEMRKAYTAVRVVPSTFVGFYADVSRLEPGRPHRFELEIPAVRPGQFTGLFFENVEPEYTTVVKPSR